MIYAPRPSPMARQHADISDAAWALIEPVVAGAAHEPRGPGRPARDHRAVVNGILWVLDTEAPWRHAPAAYGPWQTLYGRYVRWRQDGTWARIETSLGMFRFRPGRGVTRTVTILALALAAVFSPQPVRAERLGGHRGHRNLATHAPVRAGRRRARTAFYDPITDFTLRG